MRSASRRLGAPYASCPGKQCLQRRREALVERDHPFLAAVLGLRLARPLAALVLVFGGIAQQRRGAGDVGGPRACKRPGGLLFSLKSSALGVERRHPARVVVRADALGAT